MTKQPLTPEQEKTREITKRIFSVGIAVMMMGTVLVLWVALMYRFVEWAY